MLYHLPEFGNEELNNLFLCETKRFMEGLENQIPHNELAAIRQSVKQIMTEIDKRRSVKK